MKFKIKKADRKKQALSGKGVVSSPLVKHTELVLFVACVGWSNIHERAESSSVSEMTNIFGNGISTVGP